MDENKLTRLFAAARNESAPAPPDGFAAEFLRLLGRELRSGPSATASLWDQLDALFPRLALAAAVVIVLCLAADWGVTAAGLPGISDGTAQVATQYFLDAGQL